MTLDSRSGFFSFHLTTPNTKESYFVMKLTPWFYQDRNMDPNQFSHFFLIFFTSQLMSYEKLITEGYEYFISSCFKFIWATYRGKTTQSLFFATDPVQQNRTFACMLDWAVIHQAFQYNKREVFMLVLGWQSSWVWWPVNKGVMYL